MTAESEPSRIKKQQKWDKAFDANMTEIVADQLIELEPFSSIVEQKINKDKSNEEKIHTSLKDILINETKVSNFQTNEIIYRQGDYGGGAYLILSGSVKKIHGLAPEKLGRKLQVKTPISKILKILFKREKYPETRDISRYQQHLETREELVHKPIFIKQSDIDFADNNRSFDHQTIDAGSMFGILSCLRRASRSMTMVAQTDCRILHIKWQGLRDMMTFCNWFKVHLDELYRAKGLKQFLQTHPLFLNVPKENLDEIVRQTVFENFGRMDWNTSFKKISNLNLSVRLKDEPLIIEQGDYANGLLIIRSGFARVSRKYHKQQQTMDYMKAGDMIGASILLNNISEPQKLSYPYSMRAIGYVDVLRIPLSTFEQHLLPFCDLPLFERNEICSLQKLSEKGSALTSEIMNRSSSLLEFFVERRFINGTKTMVINTDRCTNCDDCVRACAAAHDNNPRFIRHGYRNDKFLVANACMHCSDPVCMVGCPTGAIHRATEGQVVINDDTCIGCATCANSCPYNNIRMVNIRDKNGAVVLDEKNSPVIKATKCDLCIDQWVTPACEKSCPHDALKRIDIHQIGDLRNWLES